MLQIIELVGAGLVIAGLWMIWPPLAVITAGLIAIGLANAAVKANKE